MLTAEPLCSLGRLAELTHPRVRNSDRNDITSHEVFRPSSDDRRTCSLPIGRTATHSLSKTLGGLHTCKRARRVSDERRSWGSKRVGITSDVRRSSHPKEEAHHASGPIRGAVNHSHPRTPPHAPCSVNLQASSKHPGHSPPRPQAVEGELDTECHSYEAWCSCKKERTQRARV